MVDIDCEHYAENNPKNEIKTRCLSPLRYAYGRDLKETPDDFSCTSDNHKDCDWFPKENGLVKKLF